MNNKKSTKRALLSSVLSLLLCLTMLIGTTFAWFTDSVTSGKNKIVSGNLDIAFEYSKWDAENKTWTEYEDVEASTSIFDEDALFEPGYTEVVKLKVTNKGNLAAKVKMKAIIEDVKEGVNKAGEKFKLSEYLQVGMAEVDAVTDRASADAVKKYDITGTELALSDLYNDSIAALLGDPFNPNASCEVTMTEQGDYSEMVFILTMPTTVGNEANHNGVDVPEVSISFNAVATQYTYEEDSFDNKYDEDADYDGEISNVASLVAALAKGGTYKVISDIALTEAATVPAGVTVTLDLGDNSISAATGNAIVNNGTLTVTGGTVKAEAAYAVSNKGTMTVEDAVIDGGMYNTGTLTVESGKVFTARGGYSHAIYHDGTSLTVNGGEFSGNGNEVINANTAPAIINGGIFQKVEKASYLLGGSNMVISDGTFIAFEPAATNKVRDNVTIQGGTFNYDPIKQVAEGYVTVSNADGTYTVVKGVAASDNDGLSDAIANGAETVVLTAGTYDLPSSVAGETLTIAGTEDTVINTGNGNGSYVGLDGANITFDGVTIKGQTSGQYNGYAHAGTMTYNNCTIEGTITVYSNSTFTNCTFNLPKDCYVWTSWGANEVTYEGCTFNTVGKALLIYHESGTSTVNVKNCTFNATAGAEAGAIKGQNCAAIEIDNSGKGVGTNTACNFTLNTSGNTIDSNFSGEWRIKTIDTAGSITVNGTNYTTLALDGKTMTINADKTVVVNE